MAKVNVSEQLWANYKSRSQGGVGQRNAIALRCRNLIRKEAHSLKERCALPFEDLEQIGTIGLLKAIDRFDPTRGIAFTSFAVPYIRGEMLHFLRDHGSTVKVPRRMREAHAKAKGIERRWVLAHGTPPSEAELATQMQMPLAKLRFIRGAIANQMAMPLLEEACEIPSPPEQAAEDHERRQQLEQAWQQLRANYYRLAASDRQLIRWAYCNGRRVAPGLLQQAVQRLS